MKKQILKELYRAKAEYISGEKLSTKLGVSRNAIWKNISSLKKEGHVIESARNRGYRLLSSDLEISQTDLQVSISTKKIGKKIICFDEIDSTNNYAKKIACREEHGTVIIAESQTAGRGRRGRDWVSPKNEGLWMSIILKPIIPLSEASKITQIAALSICNAIRELCKCEALIKWPNDIVINGKKVCGILTEMTGELGEISFIIVGIGINIKTREFTEDLSAIATSLLIESKTEVSRKELFLRIMEKFEKYYESFIENVSLESIVPEIRKYSALVGKEIIVVRGNKKIYAIAKDITSEGELSIETSEGEKIILNSGEVSIRRKNGYV
ncbi:MAG: biotin--[acetyl-CoA-carboxylase] ligase [Alkaliphilus sp.]